MNTDINITGAYKLYHYEKTTKELGDEETILHKFSRTVDNKLGRQYRPCKGSQLHLKLQLLNAENLANNSDNKLTKMLPSPEGNTTYTLNRSATVKLNFTPENGNKIPDIIYIKRQPYALLEIDGNNSIVNHLILIRNNLFDKESMTFDQVTSQGVKYRPFGVYQEGPWSQNGQKPNINRLIPSVQYDGGNTPFVVYFQSSNEVGKLQMSFMIRERNLNGILQAGMAWRATDGWNDFTYYDFSVNTFNINTI